MPIWEYHCKKCKYSFDVHKNVSELEKNEFCPKCNSKKTERQFPTKTSVIYKVRGFYSTDKYDLPLQ